MTGGATGVWVPLVTPFNFSGEIYAAKVAHNVGKLNLTGVAGYVCGDDPMLAFDEKLLLLELVAKAAHPDKKKLVRLVEPSVRSALRLAEHASACGYEAAVVDDPQSFYARCLADRSPIPIVEIPARLPLTSNALPYAHITIWEAERSREQEAAEDWLQRLAPFEAAIARHGAPGMRYAMELTGYYGGPPRLPEAPIGGEAQREIEMAMEGLRS